MTRSKKTAIMSCLLAIIMLFVGTFTINASASGPETLPTGKYYVGSFTFTDTNITPVKTMPSGAQTLCFGVRFKKSAIDSGLGRVKLTVQIRDLNGNVITSRTVTDKTGIIDGTFPRYTELFTDTITVSAGQKYQVFFDASSAGVSNGNYRSIDVGAFYSFINVAEPQI